MHLYFKVFFFFLLSSPGDTYSPSAFHQFHRAIMACLESIFCDTFANLSVNEFHVYTIQYGAYLFMQLSFLFLPTRV